MRIEGYDPDDEDQETPRVVPEDGRFPDGFVPDDYDTAWIESHFDIHDARVQRNAFLIGLLCGAAICLASFVTYMLLL